MSEIVIRGAPELVLLHQVKVYVDARQSEATTRAYQSDWRQFDTWCRAQSAISMPATPQTVATYLASRAACGAKVSTVNRALSAIAAAHREQGSEWQTHAAVAATMKGIRRTHGIAVSKKAPVTESVLREMLRQLPTDLSGIRDRALILLGWFGAFRRSEVASLAVGDLSFVSEGLIVRVARSKTDQDGHGQEKGIPSGAAICAVSALKEWLARGDIKEGRVFRSIDRHGRIGRSISSASVGQIVKAAAEAAGLDSKQFAGHSLRAGFITTAARKGKSLDAIMRTSGHRSETVARGYIRHATLFCDNAATGIL